MSCINQIQFGRLIAGVAFMATPAFFSPLIQAQQRTADCDSPADEFIHRALRPFWRESCQREPLFFIQSDTETRPTASLQFYAAKIISVANAIRDTVYEPGIDYEFDETTHSFSLPPGSKIPFRTLEQMYPLMTSDIPKYRKMQGDTTRGVFFDNGSGYHQLQVEVVYRCKPDQWQGPVPQFAGDALPRTLQKLKTKQSIQLELCGDSISAGYNASKFTKAEPGCPAYGELVSLSLAKHYESPVVFTNHAVNGWNSSQGLQFLVEHPTQGVGADLVIIAFGMNDVFDKNASQFKKNIQDIMAIYRTRSSDVEFILVASMLGNVEWGMPMEQFSLYREALRELMRQGVAMADLTEMWEELLKHKSFYDLTGNGLNHPNDYGHLIYAQTILSKLIDHTE
jgi:acyl-CoA thioesterase-1